MPRGTQLPCSSIGLGRQNLIRAANSRSIRVFPGATRWVSARIPAHTDPQAFESVLDRQRLVVLSGCGTKSDTLTFRDLHQLGSPSN